MNERKLHTKTFGICINGSVSDICYLPLISKTSLYICSFRCSGQGKAAESYHTSLWAGKDYLEKSHECNCLLYLL